MIKNMVAGSDLKELKDGRIVKSTPKFDIFYKWANGSLCHTLAEIKKDIDDFFDLCKGFGIDQEMAVAVLNKDGT